MYECFYTIRINFVCWMLKSPYIDALAGKHRRQFHFSFPQIVHWLLFYVKSALVQEMDWRRPGANPFLGPMMT